MKTYETNVRCFLFAAVLAVGCLSVGCGKVTVELRQKPYQGRGVVSPDPDPRPRQAVKVARWFWGLVDYVATPPVDWHYAERESLWKLWRTDMNLTSFYQVMGMPGETFATSKVRALGADASNPHATKNSHYLLPLTSDSGVLATMFFRLATLGIFWDAGYTTDNETWGLCNKASTSSWFGRGDTIIVMDSRGNFHVRQFEFDPSDTVRAAAKFAEEAIVLGAQVAAASALVGMGPIPANVAGTDDAFAARAKEVLDELNARAAVLRAAAGKSAEDLVEEKKAREAAAKVALDVVLRSRGAVHAATKDGAAAATLLATASVTLTAEQVEKLK